MPLSPHAARTDLKVHSDQRWKCQIKQCQHLLKKKGIMKSMSGKGNYLDNNTPQSKDLLLDFKSYCCGKWHTLRTVNY